MILFFNGHLAPFIRLPWSNVESGRPCHTIFPSVGMVSMSHEPDKTVQNLKPQSFFQLHKHILFTSFCLVLGLVYGQVWVSLVQDATEIGEVKKMCTSCGVHTDVFPTVQSFRAWSQLSSLALPFTITTQWWCSSGQMDSTMNVASGEHLYVLSVVSLPHWLEVVQDTVVFVVWLMNLEIASANLGLITRRCNTTLVQTVEWQQAHAKLGLVLRFAGHISCAEIRDLWLMAMELGMLKGSLLPNGPSVLEFCIRSPDLGCKLDLDRFSSSARLTYQESKACSQTRQNRFARISPCLDLSQSSNQESKWYIIKYQLVIHMQQRHHKLSVQT